MNPKIFISYSWSPHSNKIWVLELAERLTRDGIHVVIDEWDAVEGQDKFHFMEKMVNDKTVNFVLLICNKEYALKVNAKKGGVGIESQIISNDIYENVEQSKFIPIVKEYSESEKPYLPTFVNSRFYIDLSKADSFEDNYESLIRRIFEKPKHKRPPLGGAPAFLNEDKPVFIKTAHKLRPLKNALVNGNINLKGFIIDFFDSFYSTLIDYILPENTDINTPPIDEVILEKFENLRSLRDDYIDFLINYIKYSEIDNDLLFNFLEKAYNSCNYDNNSSYNINNHLHLFLNEIFLYTVSILLKYEKFESLSFIVKHKYSVEKKYRDITYQPFCRLFNSYNRFIDEFRKQRLNLNRVSISSDLIKARSTNQNVRLEEILETDMILHYISLIHFSNEFPWFPRMSIYRDREGIPILIQKMQSKRYFEKVKCIFNINDVDELFDKIGLLRKDTYNGYQMIYYNIIDIFSAFNKNQIYSVE